MVRELPATAPPSEIRSFADDVLVGLASVPKQLPCKYFYDARGSQLFDAITELEEYYPTRAEIAVMDAHAADMAAAIGPGALIVELGSGSSIKTRLLLDRLDRPAGYVPVDISADHLEQAAASIARDYPELEVLPVAADFTRGFTVPRPRRTPKRCVVYFPGSTVGNFPAPRARDLLAAVARCVQPQADERPGGLLLGFDLVKAPATLVAAYDDAQGVTAAFNLNLLARINRELDGTFDLEQFEHRAVWEPATERIAIYIRSRRDQVVRAAGGEFRFAAGEDLLTEHSHKYTEASITGLTRDAGFARSRIWTDTRARFAVGLFQLG